MEPMEDQLVQRSLREPGTAVLPPATTEGGVKTKVIDWVKHPHGHTDALDDGIAQRDEETEVEIIHHATVRDDGTYYRLFALDGTLYRVDDMVLVGCDDEDPALCRITSLWEDHQGHKMVELQQGDDDDERDEVEIEGLVSLAATKASGGQKEAAPPPVEEKAAGPTTAASKRSSFVHEGLPPDLITCTKLEHHVHDLIGGQSLPETSSTRPTKRHRGFRGRSVSSYHQSASDFARLLKAGY